MTLASHIIHGVCFLPLTEYEFDDHHGDCLIHKRFYFCFPRLLFHRHEFCFGTGMKHDVDIAGPILVEFACSRLHLSLHFALLSVRLPVLLDSSHVLCLRRVITRTLDHLLHIVASFRTGL